MKDETRCEMARHDLSDDDQMGPPPYDYNPQHAHAYQDHLTPPQLQMQHGATEDSDAFKSNRYTDHNTIVTMSLRAGRFVVLVILSLAAAFTFATLTIEQIELTTVTTQGTNMSTNEFNTVVEDEVSKYNALSGTIMFAVSKVFEVFTETLVFPTLHTYLHNCPLFPGDVPQRVHSKVKANAIFWGLKTLIIFMNVGFSSLYVGRSSPVMNHEATRRLTAGVDLDAHLALTPLWADAAHSNVTDMSDVLDTILRSAVTGSTAAVDADDDSRCVSPNGVVSVHDLDTSSVTFGFAAHDWSADVLRHGAEPTQSVRFTLAEFEQQRDRIEAAAAKWLNAELVTTAYELLAQGASVLSASLDESTSQSPVRTTNSLAALVEQTATSVNATLAIDASMESEIAIAFAVHELSDDVSIVSLSVDVPIATSAVGGSVLCGAHRDACVYAHELTASRLSLRPGVAMLPYAVDANAMQHERDAAFVFGLGQTYKARPIRGISNTDMPQEIVSLSFGKLMWRPAPLHVRHGVECADVRGCIGLSVPVTSKRGVVLVSDVALPTDHLRATPANPMRLVTLNPVVHPGSGGDMLMTWDRVVGRGSRISDVSATNACIRDLVDAHLDHIDANRFVLESPLQTMYTSALLYLLQNGVYTAYADAGVTATTRRLALAAADQQNVDINIEIPKNSSIATFAGCGVMVLLAVFVILFPTDRVKLSPNTTAAAQYVQILTDDLYPDVVHKKRLRFINGDVLLFNEYVCDSIVLHAKVNEKKKIYL